MKHTFLQIKTGGSFRRKTKSLPLIYHDVKLNVGYRIDLMVEHKVVLELKVVEVFNDIHMAQILTYPKLSKCKVGWFIGF